MDVTSQSSTMRAYLDGILHDARTHCMIPGSESDVDMIRLLRRMRKERLLGWRFVRERPLAAQERHAHPSATVAWDVHEVDPGSPEGADMGVPRSLRAFINATNQCTTLCAGMCLQHPLLVERGLRLCMQSASLGRCHVVSMHTAAGHRLVDHELAYNPLLVSATTGRTQDTLLAPPVPNVRKANGNKIYMYEHHWLAMAVLDADGRHHPVSLDPTAAQFGGEKDVVLWHPGLPAARDLYTSDGGVRQPEELEELLARTFASGYRVADEAPPNARGAPQ
jgi:hypothetical protein